MKTLASILILFGLILSCNTSKTTSNQKNKNEKTYSAAVNDTVIISNKELEYQIIIIEPGFNSWLATTAKPEGYFSQQFLENKNYQYVTEWNQRVLQSQQYDSNLYELRIDYKPSIDYGYEVNYKLYNYFIYFQLTYKQQLAGPVTRF